MRVITFAALLIGLTGCTAAAEPEIMQTQSAEVEPQATETMDPMDPMESEPAETSEATQTQSPSPSPTATVSSSPSPTATATPSPTQTQTSLTLAEVAKRNTQAECWVAIDGNVYDLTDWIRQHPGGSAAIRSLCGTDGTDQFLSQHGGEASPSSQLGKYLLGPLAR